MTMAFILKALIQCLLHVGPGPGNEDTEGSKGIVWCLAGQRLVRETAYEKIIHHNKCIEREHYEYTEQRHVTWGSGKVPGIDI